MAALTSPPCDDSQVDKLARQLHRQQATQAVKWEALGAQERSRWRRRATESLAALAALGYRIEAAVDHEGPATQDAEAALDAAGEAEELLRIGEPLLAYNALQQALEDQPRNHRLRQLKGLALSRSGALRRANEELSALRDEGAGDGETLGLLARTHKALALQAADSASRKQHLGAAYEIYASGYARSKAQDALSDAYYTGINAAAMAFLNGDRARAGQLAAEVEALCERALAEQGAGAGAYWAAATLAEAALIGGDPELARQRYASAAKLASKRYGDLSSTRQQARLLLAHSGAAEDWLDDVLRIPPVVVYTGHMIDAPGRAVPRFPAEREGAVRDQVRAFLEQIQPVAAYGSAACGADILCLECVQELGGELHIVLPFPAEQFRQVSVDLWPGSDWGSRFERLLASTEKVFTISEHMPPSGTSTFEYANVIMTGLARLRADVLQTSVHGLAVWDGQGAGGAGGTGTVVDMWRRYGVPLEHIDLGTGDAGHGADGITGQYAVSGEPSPFEYTIKAMLFADAVGYSRLNEDQIPLFFEHYLGTIAAYNAQTPHRAQHVETAGDGMYMVFDDPADAGHYALGLSELLNSVDWERCALPANLSARIALHCGPVFAGQDPITGTPIYSGTHTSRTARIEPITPPGQVYASGAFAAIAAARNIEGLRFSYIGRTQLAKRYGALALYHVKHP
jgi:hypothetical protein